VDLYNIFQISRLWTWKETILDLRPWPWMGYDVNFAPFHIHSKCLTWNKHNH